MLCKYPARLFGILVDLHPELFKRIKALFITYFLDKLDIYMATVDIPIEIEQMDLQQGTRTIHGRT